MLMELHCHTDRYSPCSHLDPVAAVRRVVARGLQGLVITEHQRLWSEPELAELRRAAEVSQDFVLLAGQEVETELGHVLVFGADRSLAGEHLLADLRAEFPEAALVLAHPWRHERGPRTHKLLHPALDAVEIFNSNHSARGNYMGLRAWHEHKFTATAGSDAHAESTAGLYPTQFDHPLADLPGLIAELRAGRCRPFIKEIPRSGSNVTVTEITIGTKGDDDFRERIVVRQIREDHKWRRALGAVQVIEALHAAGFTGGRFRVPRIVELDERDRLIIEEGQRGRFLYELLARLEPAQAAGFFDLAAAWLAQMHRAGLRVTGLEHARKRESRRFRSYRRAFERSHSPYLAQAESLLQLIEAVEEDLFARHADRFVQCHGDFHPKNILVGQDYAQDASTTFVSVIDFDSSQLFLPAFDLGTFLAQMGYQLRGTPRVLARLDRQAFLDRYLEESGQRPSGLAGEVDFFELRTLLSMAAFLIKVGKGTSPDMDLLMGRARELRIKLAKARGATVAGRAG